MSTALNVPPPDFMNDEDIRIFADMVGAFFKRHAPPTRTKAWRAAGQVERAFWTEAGQAGLLGLMVPAAYGGPGGDLRHEIILVDAQARHDVDGFAASLHNVIITPYVIDYGTHEQKQRWLHRLVNGDLIAAVAMTEPDAGSDLQAIRATALRDGNGYRINGQKTYISNGQLANFIVVVAKTDPAARGRGISLLVVETDQAEGFRRGRNLDKVGQDAADTSELFFDNVWVPAENLLGLTEGQGFAQLMGQLPRERLIIAVQAAAEMERALEVTLDFVRHRRVFGQAVLDYQNTQFRLAECKTLATIARVFVNHCIGQALAGTLDDSTAAMAKYWTTDTLCKIVDECLQLHGGAGYMNEYLIGRMYRDARVSRIYGGTNEIMKILIARGL
ncbi:MAG: acyl-CoA dehydrogenase family protein [Acidocella sp.]|nr:acyl-CoA dehydrogenase family protein [Acidocella sp.]